MSLLPLRPAQRRLAWAAPLLTILLLTPTAEAARPTLDQPYAVLRGLDKVTARISVLPLPVGESVEFGTLRVTVRACRTTPPEEAPENAAFLEIDDFPPGRDGRRVFSGWMFSSAPAVSALEHAVYDIWIVECVATRPPDPAALEAFEEEAGPSLHSLPDNPPLPPETPASRRPL